RASPTPGHLMEKGMSAVPRRKPQRNMVSICPPRHVTMPLGGYRTTTLQTGVRIAAHLLSEAAITVSHKITTKKEWDYVYQSFEGRSVEPESGRPCYYMAEAVEQRHARFNTGKDLDTKNPDKAVAELAEKLRKLDYLESWAILIAVRWREEYDHETAQD